jgi:DNA-binding CsgD family transcriptional regulator
MTYRDDEPQSRDRLWATLERLLALEAMELERTLDEASQIVAEALGADKVDTFVYEPATESLVALGTSDTPMGRRQHAIGLHRLPLANGGRAAQVFRSGKLHVDGHVDADPEELEGIKIGLGVRSALVTPLDVGGERRGVLSAVSARPNDFSADDVPFFDSLARWLALVMHRVELVRELGQYREERGRQKAILEMLNLLTPRQREVAACIAGGMSNAEIARQLTLTQGTVANHVEGILRRLSFRSRSEVAALVVGAGVSPLPFLQRDLLQRDQTG